MPVGALIGTECMTDDGTTIGTVVYLDRDRRGRPEWIDVTFHDRVRRDHDVEPERVRFSAGLIAGWDEDTLELKVDLAALRSRWSPSRPEEIEVPVF